MEHNLFKNLLVLLIIFNLTMVNFILVGVNVVSYAVDGDDIVKFNAQLNEEENLSLSVTVPNSSDLYNGVITLNEEESNFKFAINQSSQYINVVEDRKIELKTLSAGKNANIYLKIEPIKDASFDIGMLDMTSKLYFSGECKDNEGKDKTVSLVKEVKYEYKENNTDENIESTAKIITNKIIKISGEDKRVVQLEMNLGLKENNYPIKEIELNMDVPSIVSDTTDTAYIEPEVVVKADLNTMTHWETKYEDHRLNIKFTNEANQNGKVTWKKQGSEKVVISLIFDKDATLDAQHIEYKNLSSEVAIGEPRVKVTLYDEKVLNSIGTLRAEDVNQKLGQEQLVDITLENSEDTIYKGKLNAGIDRKFSTKTYIEVNLANAEEYIEVREDNNYIVNQNEVEANVVFNKTVMSKRSLEHAFGTEEKSGILGVNGKITFLNENNEELATVDKNTKREANDSVVIDYSGKEPRKLIIKTTAPEEQGNITFINTKTLKEQDRDIIKAATDLSIKATFKYSENQFKQSETTIKLIDTKTEAEFTSTVTNFSTLETNKNVQFTVKLLSNNEMYELYKNPIIDIIIPEELNIDVKNVELLNFQDQFEISHRINQENNTIHIELSGEQKEFANSIDNGISVVVIADVRVSNKIPSKDSEIIMEYCNENTGEEMQQTKLPIKISSKEGTLIVNKISGYRNDEFVESIQQENNIKLDRNVEEKVLKNELAIVNNNGKAMINPIIVIQFPDIINNSTFINTLKKINIDGKNKDDSITFLFSNNINEPKESSNWLEKDTMIERNLPVRAIKISISGEISEAKLLNITYEYTIPKNLKNTDYSFNNVNVFYSVDGVEESTHSKFNFTINAENQEGQDNNPTETNEGDSNTQEESDYVRVEQVVKSGNKVISKDESVSEGQGIKYEIKVTNLKNEDINNVKIIATNENAVYFGNVKENENVYGVYVEVERFKEDQSIQAKELNIGTIKAGETKIVSYQIAVAEVEDNNQFLSGELNIIGSGIENKTLEMQKNRIIKSLLKLNLEFKVYESAKVGIGDGFPIELTIKNISSDMLNNVNVEFPIPDGLEFSTKYFFTEYEGAAPASFVENTNGKVLFNIPSIKSGEKSIIGIKLIATESKDVNAYFTASINNRVYISNMIEKTIINNNKKLDINLSSNVTGSTVKDGQNIVYYIDVTNNETEELYAILSDKIPYELFVNSVKKGNEEIKINTEIFTDIISLKPGESIRYVIDGILHADCTQSDKLSNYAKIESAYVTVESNELIYTIEGKNKDGDSSEENDSNNSNDQGNGGNKEADDSESTNKKYSISGVAFEDVNNNGMRDFNEPIISGIPVLLLNEATGKIAIDKDNKSMETVTSNSGEYIFTNLPKGKYTVLFKYNSSDYSITEYKKPGIDETNNSDVVYKEISINNNISAYASTETLNISENDLANIDAGFVKKKKFDLKLDKVITKTIVQNGEGTRETTYEGSKLAKVEIRAKELANTTMIVEYTIKVTNEGELEGYASEIIDYIPNGLKFSSEMNKNWYQGTDGNLLNRELVNTIINPGETKSIKLTLTKNINTSNTGTFMNSAEINKISNRDSAQDIDSTPGNRDLNEDDFSTAELIISIGTGSIVINILIIANMIAVIGVGAFIIKKKVLNIED